MGHGDRIQVGSKNLWIDHDGRWWSYATCIVDKLPDGRTIGNDTSYSNTTSHHQAIAGVRGCDIIVHGVPRGTDSLAEWFQTHGEWLRPGEVVTVYGKPLTGERIEGKARLVDAAPAREDGLVLWAVHFVDGTHDSALGKLRLFNPKFYG